MNLAQRKWLTTIARVAAHWAVEAELSPPERAVARSLSWFARRLSHQRRPSDDDLSQVVLMACHLCRGRNAAELAEAGCPEGSCALMPKEFAGHPYLKHLQLMPK